ncbi:hypothetical protein BVC80_9097g94 [Macleaya cordata]|uniref:Uncharacterized protein n=1 Tax=Macleaya cordata TaxID=56857 RepID=A0A200QF58_MACCD|nr:hypothetical protein BVC80_9097g94 [Macleaya cordata]
MDPEISINSEPLFQSLGLVMTKEGEAQEEAMKELAKNLKMVEEGIQEFFSGVRPAFDGKSPIFLNILLVSLLGPYQIVEKVTGAKIIDPERNPLIFSLVTALKELPEVKEATPPHDKLEALVRYIREKDLQSSST